MPGNFSIARCNLHLSIPPSFGSNPSVASGPSSAPPTVQQAVPPQQSSNDGTKSSRSGGGNGHDKDKDLLNLIGNKVINVVKVSQHDSDS